MLNPGTARAQQLVEAELRQGYYAAVSASGGFGWADDEDLGDLGTGLDVGARIRLGQMLSPRWGAGVLLLGGSSSNGTFDGIGGGAGLELTVYPFERIDLALRPSVGLLVTGYSRQESELETSDDPGSLYAARLASSLVYDLWCWSDLPEGGGRCVSLGVDVAFNESDGLRAVSGVAMIELQGFWGLAKRRLRGRFE